MVAVGLLAALGSGMAIGAANYFLIRALRIPPIIATFSASFIIQWIDISYGRGLQIKPPPGYADFTNFVGGIPILADARGSVCTVAAGVASTERYMAVRVTCNRSEHAGRVAGRGSGRRVRFLDIHNLCGTLGGLNGALLAGRFPRRQCRYRQRIPARVRSRSW